MSLQFKSGLLNHEFPVFDLGCELALEVLRRALRDVQRLGGEAVADIRLASALRNSRWSRLTVSRGVPFGAKTPYHAAAVKSFKPDSLKVVTSGS